MSKITDSLSRIHSLEELAEGKTAVHRLHPMIKIITTILFLVVVISYEKYRISGLMPFFLYPVLLMAVAEIPYRAMFARLLVALPFAFFAGLSNPFLDRRLAFALMGIPITYGLISFASILIKTILTVMAVLILIAATPMDRLAHELIRMKLPKIFVMQIMLTYRYLGLLISEAGNMTTAYHLRSSRQKGIRMEHAGTFMGQLLLRSFDRADKVYTAMKLRGFNGEYHFAGSEKIRRVDWFYGILVCSAFLMMRWLNFSLIIGSLFQ